MCGIGGCVMSPGRRPSRSALAAMAAAMRHRGPDGGGVILDSSVGLVHQRLAIVDPTPAGDQPLKLPDDAGWLTFNGEIYNHLDLRDSLRRPVTGSHSDTVTLAALLQERGTPALPLLNGQFAFAVLLRKENRLVLARDRFGIKPLFIAEADGGFWFASEANALLAAGVVPRVRADAWASVLVGSHYSGDNTLLEGITRIPAGCFASIDLTTAQLTVTRWYEAAEQVDRDRGRELATKARSQLAHDFEGVLRNAVHDAMLSDVPVGTFLSGGVDSSIITALAKERRPDLLAFGAHYRSGTIADEGSAALAAAAAIGVDFDLHEVTEGNWCDEFVSATLHFGLPLANASSIPIAHMARKARSLGVKVILTGEGADELFAGYRSLHHDAIKRFLPRHMQISRALETIIFSGSHQGLRSVLSEACRLVAARAAPGPIWETLTAIADDAEHRQALDQAYANHAAKRRELEVTLLKSLDYTLCHLLTRMDANVMQASVEARVPFLDPRVVELALNLPLELRLGPWSKGLVRDVGRSVLPTRVAQRPKVYGMDFDAGAWIEAKADPFFLRDGIVRNALAPSPVDFDEAIASARGALRIRIWSMEVWARSVFLGHQAARIEEDLWS